MKRLALLLLALLFAAPALAQTTNGNLTSATSAAGMQIPCAPIGGVAGGTKGCTPAQIVSAGGALLPANNLSDLASASAARTSLGLGSIATQSSSSFLGIGGGTLTGPLTLSADATSSLQAVTLEQLQSYSTGQRFTAVAVATSNISTTSAPASIDGVSPSTGACVLLEAETASANNGLWQYPGSGSAFATRCANATTWAGIYQATVFVTGGTANANTGWAFTVGAGGTIGTTSITLTQISAPGSYSAGTGLSQSGTTFSIASSGVSAGSYGSGAAVPVLTVNAQGQVTSASTTSLSAATSSVAGVVKPDGTSILNSSGAISVTPASVGACALSGCTMTGALGVGGSLQVTGASAPQSIIYASGNGSNLKYSREYDTNGSLTFDFPNDAFSSSNVWMTVTRSGYSPTGVTLNEPLYIPNTTTGDNSTKAANTAAVLGDIATYAASNTQVAACDTTGATDCSSTLQTIINALQTAGGGHVILPAGTINLTSGVTLTNGGIWISGQGWQDFNGTFGGHSGGAVRGTQGTYIYTTSATASPFTCGAVGYVGGNQCVITDMAFTESQPSDTSGWNPTTHAAAILHYGNSLTLRNIMFWGIERGLQVGDSASNHFAGRTYTNHVYGACFVWCFDIESASDVQTITDTHLYSYFLDGNPNEIAYILANGIGLRSARDDNPFISDFFDYGSHTGFDFESNTNGTTANAQVQNVDLDGVPTALLIDATFTGRFTNFQSQTDWNGTTGSSNSENIVVNSGASNVVLDMANVNLNNALAHAIDIQSTSGQYGFTNLHLGTYDRNNGGYTGIGTTTGNTVAITGTFTGASANGTVNVGSPSLVTINGKTNFYGYSPIVAAVGGSGATFSGTAGYASANAQGYDLIFTTTISAAGSGNTSLTFSLPAAAGSFDGINQYLTGSIEGVDGYLLKCTVGASATSATCTMYNNATPFVTGGVIEVSGSYRTQ